MYRAWVRKEAVVKLTGHGLGLEPNCVDVRNSVAVVTGVPGWLPDEPIKLLDLPATFGYCAALASTRTIHRVLPHQVGEDP